MKMLTDVLDERNAEIAALKAELAKLRGSAGETAPAWQPIRVEAMTILSDPHATVEQYRAAVLRIYNLARLEAE